MTRRFGGRVAIVTGAGTGLGPVMARMPAAAGARVVLAAQRVEPSRAVARTPSPSAPT